MNDRGGVVCLWGRDVRRQSQRLVPLRRRDRRCRSFSPRARGSFIECGGHNASGGFSVSHETGPHARGGSRARAASLSRASSGCALGRNLPPTMRPSTLGEISWPLLRDVSRIAPFGIGNPKPVFKIARDAIVSMKAFGKEKNHWSSCSRVRRTALRCARSISSVGPKISRTCRWRAQQATLLATLERDNFRSPARLALRIIDVLPG